MGVGSAPGKAQALSVWVEIAPIFCYQSEIDGAVAMAADLPSHRHELLCEAQRAPRLVLKGVLAKESQKERQRRVKASHDVSRGVREAVPEYLPVWLHQEFVHRALEIIDRHLENERRKVVSSEL